MMNTTMARDKRAKWKRYIESAEHQVMVLMDRRRWNRVYETIVNANPMLPAGNPMLRHFRLVYAEYAVMAIRRQAKAHDDAFSLRDLISDIASNPTAVTLSATIEQYQEPLPNGHCYDEAMATDLARMTFTKFADTGGELFDAHIAIADVERLDAATAKIITHADSYIAHDDKIKPEQTITFDEIDFAVLLLEELTKRYSLLLTGRSWGTLTPYDQGDTLAAFKLPWIDPEHAPHFNTRDAF
jgi:AbiU2